MMRLLIFISLVGLLSAYIAPRFRFNRHYGVVNRAFLMELQMSDIMADDGGFPEDNEESLPETDADQEEDDADQVEEEKDEEEVDELDDELDGLRLEALDNLSAADSDDGSDDDDDEDFVGEGNAASQAAVDGVTVVKKVVKKRGLLTERRAKKKADLLVKKKEGRSWEDKFVDDPLKADEPTVVLEQEKDYFTKVFVAMAMIKNGEQVEARAKAWTHHQQWVRRNTLLVDNTKVEREFTMLSNDLMVPVGQLLMIKANQSQEVQQFLKSEPLVANNGIDSKGWSLYEMNACDTEMYANVTNHLRNPYVFVGDIKKKNEWDSRTERESYKYHNSEDRSTYVGTLSDINSNEIPEKFLAIFNSITSKDANRYIASDPNVIQGLIDHDTCNVSPCNEQDIDGLNHFMARSFGEKEEMDKIHFLDPEDLLMEETDPSYDVTDNVNLVANRLVLDELEAKGISYRYNRYSLEKFKDILSEKDVIAFNEYMGRSQKTRLEPAVDTADSVEEKKKLPAKALDDDVEA